nr:hypothetical protein BCU57_03700 [Shewanella sp. 10N.286.48.B5]
MAIRIKLKPKRERSLERRHPWVFSNGIHNVNGGKPQAGDTVEVVGHDGRWLARGAWSPESQIQVRVWTFDKEETIDAEFFARRIQRAQARRVDVLMFRVNAVRSIPKSGCRRRTRCQARSAIC